MKNEKRQVHAITELQAAAADANVHHIELAASLDDVPTLHLSPGQTLTGIGAHTVLRFATGRHGLRMSTDNQVRNLHLLADPDKCAIFNDGAVEHMGHLILHGLTVTGLVRVLARDRVQGGHLEAHDIDVMAADARNDNDWPDGYGVKVRPGAFTLWNQQRDPAIVITANLTGLTAGRAGARQRHLRQRSRTRGRPVYRAST